MISIFSELKRRHVHRTAAFYAAGGWLVVQIATQVAPYFDMPNWTVRLVIVAVLGGFPISILLSWYYEWSPATGWRRELDAPAENQGRAARPDSLLPDDAGSAEAPSDKSIAVLSFADMSQAKDQEYFSDGLAEELLNLLAQLPQLRVVARTSSFSFKGKDVDAATIGKALKVATLLAGSVRKHGNTLRINTQLIRAADNSHLWSQTYDRELTDVFKAQDEIAQAVVEALKVRLMPEQQLTNQHRTSNTAAHDQFLLGQGIFRRGRYEDFSHAMAAFQRAVQLDPTYAPAYAALAYAENSVADFCEDSERRAELQMEALASANHAVALAPELADGYVIRGRLRSRNLWNWVGALQDLERALELDPNSSEARLQYGLVLQYVDRIPESLAIAKTVTEDDPLSWLAWFFYGALLRDTGRMAEARTALQRALDLNPESSWIRYVLGGLDLFEGKPEAALAIYLQAGAAYRQAGIAMAEHSLGHERESAQALAELEAKYANGFSIQIADVQTWRGNHDAAFAALERACTQTDSGLARIRTNRFLHPLRGDPRYTALLDRLAFPKYEATGA
jgi:TolB-like protein